MWLALDLTVHPPDAKELAAAEAACAETHKP
jgi:hypothetical protein